MILEEAGKKRAFKVNQGKLTIGSGDDAVLRLESAGVAEKHAELEISAEGEVVLRPFPGVMPPKVGGKPVEAPTRIPLGAAFHSGEARFPLLADEGDAPTRVAAPKAAPAAGAARTRGKQVRAVAAPDAPARGGAKVQRTRPVATIKKGMPGWLMGLLLLVGIGGTAIAFLRYQQRSLDEGSSAKPGDLLSIAESNWEARNFANAERIAKDLAGKPLSVTEQARLDALGVKMKERAEELREISRNEEGTTYLDTQLKKFEEMRLQGNPERKKVRVFLIRCEEFLKTWPTHPGREWVERQKTRFSGMVDLSKPPTWEEADYEIETLTWAWPPRFREAYARLEPFLSGPNAADARARRDALDDLQQERFDDKIQQAKFEWNKPDGAGKGKGVEVLRQIIVNFTDQEKVDTASGVLIQLPGIESWLSGYKDSRPDSFDNLMTNPQVRAVAAKAGLL